MTAGCHPCPGILRSLARQETILSRDKPRGKRMDATAMASIAISIAALVVSISAFVASRYRDRRDLMLKIHDRLVAPDQRRGRRLIYQVREAGTAIDGLTEDQYALINNALSTLNVLGIYYERRYVARTDVLRFFALNVVRLMPAAEAFLAHRDQVVGTVSWPELRTLAADSANYLRRQGQEARPALREAGKEGASGSPSPTG